MKNILRGLPACALASLIGPVCAQEPAKEYTLEMVDRAARFQGTATNEQRGDAGPQGSRSSKERQKAEDVEEIVVTGTHIRGAVSAGSNVSVITREEITRSGYATAQDVLKTLPQNFGGGASEDNVADASALNLNLGNAVNLRGLGADSTLVLVNGRRQPAGGLSGAFVDISSIAASAIERVEVLADGASAIYGSDAVGGVVNFVLLQDYEGAETRLRFGTLGGDASESQLSHLIGETWGGGNVLFGYQYYERDALAREDRAYTASDDLRLFGGSDFRSFHSNPGNILDPLTLQPALAIPRDQDGTTLVSGDLLPGIVNLSSRSEQGDLLPRQVMHSAFLNVSQSISESTDLSLEGRYNTRDTTFRSSGFQRTLIVPASNPFFVDPGDGLPFAFVAYNFLDDLGPQTSTSATDTMSATLAAAVDLPRTWKVTIAGTFGEEKAQTRVSNSVNDAAINAALADPDPSTAFNPFAHGSNTSPTTLESIRAVQRNRARARVSIASATADGAVFELEGGEARLAVGADLREEDLASDQSFPASPTTGAATDRRVAAAFAELALPLMGSHKLDAAGQRIELSLAARYEDYSDFGTSFNPKFGVNWQPRPSLRLRGTWGTSFKAPRLVDLLDSPAASLGNADFVTQIADPQSQTGFSPALIRFGNNAHLEAETATTWTAGLDLLPVNLPGTALSLTYFDIDYDDRIGAGGPAGNPLGVLLDGEAWAEIIDRTPSQEELAAICTSPRFVFGDCSAPLAAIVDLRLRNLSSMRLRGVDLSARHAYETRNGAIGLGLDAGYALEFERAISDRAQPVDLVDTVGNVPALRLRGTLTWTWQGFAATVFGNYMGRYQDPLANRPVDSYTTVDLGLTYDTSNGRRWLDGIQIGLNAVNLFDKEPPFVNAQFFGYDTANADLLGRVLSVYITKSW